MTVAIDPRRVCTILLDIEGTTTPMAFVHEVLFSYARARLASFIERHAADAEIADVARLLAGEHEADVTAGQAPPSWLAQPAQALQESLVRYGVWLMDRDRKSPGLKLLQGLIWEAGYQRGELHGEVYADVPAAMRAWHEAGTQIAIYSSGSELAQRRLFESVPSADLTPLIDAFFDTRVGAKVDANSYRRIAEILGRAPGDVLFVSDVTRELAAARSAGMQVVLSVRPGNAPQPDAGDYRVVRSLGEFTV